MLASIFSDFFLCHKILLKQTNFNFRLRAKRRPNRRRCQNSGRPGRNRTHNPRFWRPVLCQIELLAYYHYFSVSRARIRRLTTPIWHATPCTLLRLAVQGMLATARAEFTQLQATRVIAPILFSCVIPFLTLGASQSDYRSDIFL